MVNAHQICYNNFARHPSRLSTMQRGLFIRHLNGVLSDNDIWNLAEVHPYDAFKHPDWVVDWKIPLNSREVDFVLANLDTFAEIYREGPLGTIGHTRIAEGSPQEGQTGAIVTVPWTDGEIKKREKREKMSDRFDHNDSDLKMGPDGVPVSNIPGEVFTPLTFI